ncbi:SDR family oxidoreductase [Paraburkholderia sp. WS6]|uniref:SDR family NAD(P)-dependent oxidoreductase n=2 Tax=Burkholderiaceae TaxID=119060 RepID=A0AAP5BM84_9BURK|nr:SDR family NAD(P)-dependent oxidoreductase [Paraburkholderia madseniana]MDN7155315.1 SDR family oxidoreductase [Paraburkholderia sp. WS6]MDQ6414198.1 SDR family oxidoreductase [Paraburkholderia madseniana]
MRNMQGKVVIVTGAASGQGAAEAKLFAEHGAKVVVTDIDERGEDIAASFGSSGHFVRHDVGDEGGWAEVMRQTLDRFERIDVLVNNAGVFKPAALMETDVTLWQLHYRVNQLGVFLGMRAASEVMVKTGGGAIINVCSNAALNNVPGMFAYASTKWAVRGMTKLAASEFATLGIRVNSIYPGIIDTPMLGQNSAEQLTHYKSMIPMQRLGTPDEVARLVLFLASDDASYITGGEVTIDGGIG